MYERFTDRTRRLMRLANQEAINLNHEYIGTEHILLGLVKEGSGNAATILRTCIVDLLAITNEIHKLIQRGPEMAQVGKLPQTPRAKKVIEYSMEESRNLNHNYVGTEHILLGLLREQEGVAAQVLMNLGVKIELVRAEIPAGNVPSAKPIDIAALEEAIMVCEAATTRLSCLLAYFDLSSYPQCDKDLNQADVGTKIRVAKFLVAAGKVFQE